MQSMVQLCGLAFEVSGDEVHGEDWAVPETLRIDEDALSIVKHCGDLLAKAADAVLRSGPLPEETEPGPSLRLSLLKGLLAAVRLTLKAHRRLAHLGEQRAGLSLHLLFISSVMVRLAELARVHWQQPSLLGEPSSPARQPRHEPGEQEEELLLSELYHAAWRALIVTQTFPAYPDDLPKIHRSAAIIILQLIRELVLMYRQVPGRLPMLGRLCTRLSHDSRGVRRQDDCPPCSVMLLAS